MSETYLTYPAKLSLSQEQKCFLDDYAVLFGEVCRQYYAALKSGRCKSRKDYHVFTGQRLPYRVMRGVEQHLKGQIKSQEANRKNCIAQDENKLDTLKGDIAKLAKKVVGQKRSGQDHSKTSQSLFQKRRRFKRLSGRIERMKSDKDSHICFGGRKLFKARHDASTEDGLVDWKTEWLDKRHSEIKLVGSHDEVLGNSNCQMKTADDDFAVSIAVPELLREKYGTRVTVDRLAIRSDRHGYVRNAVLINQYSKKEGGTPISYLLKRKKGQWYIHVTVRLPEQEKVSDSGLGAIGVDINADHLAISETDGAGNLLNYWTEKLPLRNKTTDQRLAVIGDAVKEVVSIAEAARKPVVIEKLDFKQKKRQLHKENPVYARMLSSLAYEKIKSLIEVNCAKRGLECITINPAYSSQIGAVKYKEKYGLSTHHAAALVIARRGLGFWDRPLRNYYQTKDRVVVSHPAPVRKTGSAMLYYREFFSWKRRLLREIGTGMRFGEAVALAAGTQRRSLAS